MFPGRAHLNVNAVMSRETNNNMNSQTKFDQVIKPLNQDFKYADVIIDGVDAKVKRITDAIYRRSAKYSKIYYASINLGEFSEEEINLKVLSILDKYSIPGEINIYWPSYRGVGFKLPRYYLSHHLLDIWIPSAQDLFVTNEENSVIIVVHHEEFIEVWIDNFSQ